MTQTTLEEYQAAISHVEQESAARKARRMRAKDVSEQPKLVRMDNFRPIADDILGNYDGPVVC